MNQLILIGANKYGAGMGGARLEGCLNDLTTIYNWTRANRFKPGKINVTVLADEAMDANEFRRVCEQAVKNTVAGEWIWVHDSSHGTTLAFSGINHGALCCFNSNWQNRNSFILEDDFFALANAKKDGVHLFLTVDACEFGNSVREVSTFVSSGIGQVPRFIAPPFGQLMEIQHNIANGAEHRSVIADRGLKNVTTIAGCEEGVGKTCADVRDPSGAYGAFTKNVVKYLNDGYTSKVTTETRLYLANNSFEQKPVWSGDDAPVWTPVI